MHEMAIVTQLHNQVIRAIRQQPQPGSHVECPESIGSRTTVCIQVGQLEHLDHLVMTTVWQAVTADTFLAGSQLDITSLPLLVTCRHCCRDYAPEDQAILMCPYCEHIDPDVKQGTGVVLNRIFIDEPVRRV